MIVGLSSKQTPANLAAHKKQEHWFRLAVKIIRWRDSQIKGKKTELITKREWRIYSHKTLLINQSNRKDALEELRETKRAIIMHGGFPVEMHNQKQLWN